MSYNYLSNSSFQDNKLITVRNIFSTKDISRGKIVFMYIRLFARVFCSTIIYHETFFFRDNGASLLQEADDQR